MLLHPHDLRALEQRGLSPGELYKQIHTFTHHTHPVVLDRPCTPEDGIIQPDPAQAGYFAELYERKKRELSIVKFVPASGAASRMFSHLHHYHADDIGNLNEEFILHFTKFPFVSRLREILQQNDISLDTLVAQNRWGEVFGHVLHLPGLNYSQSAKGLVIFHNYTTHAATAFEEQVHEALLYASGNQGEVRLHFTVSAEHVPAFIQLGTALTKRLSESKIIINLSMQEPATDTPALDTHNEPARNSSGEIIFRPAGHGALLQNLQEVQADVIFLRNIDNISVAELWPQQVTYKKMLGGLLLELKEKSFELLDRLESGDALAITEGRDFVHTWFRPGVLSEIDDSDLAYYVSRHLDRPIRVCAMVRNEGEPGGGPFWVYMSDGMLSKQIVEKGQIDRNDHTQQRILASATHFNPVDMVCSIRNRKGDNYHLQNYVDHSTGFVSEKFHEGRIIKALELPGLWNGGMALWNTVFVEVPIHTFHPVKTVNDLLRPGHQPA